MFAISAFLLVGLVTLSSATPLKNHCKEVPAKENFDPNSYFKGTWYLTHITPVENRACISIKPQITEKTVKESYTILERGNTHKAEGFINLDSFSGSGKFETTIKPVEKPRAGTPDFHTMNETVIDTDYENYAVVHSCFTDYQGPSVYQIMGRSPNPDEVHSNVEKVLERLGMKLSNFGSTKQLNCQKAN
ncbi:hypothetical protein O3M35_005253 [Rhynocoris fuscipes]|uniref:Nitrophorin domain-containing protein n=1 Tax=Rhynocoris fuscipes TaxID=488301 RepID=A0AAW1DJT8_9HEMI